MSQVQFNTEAEGYSPLEVEHGLPNKWFEKMRWLVTQFWTIPVRYRDMFNLRSRWCLNEDTDIYLPAVDNERPAKVFALSLA